jgi:hypothetical protein
VIRAGYALVRATTALVCAARGLTKSFGERIRGRNPKGFTPATSEALSPQLQVALAYLFSALEAITAGPLSLETQLPLRDFRNPSTCTIFCGDLSYGHRTT